jgi:dolichol-phosphate mannosyltransferase
MKLSIIVPCYNEEQNIEELYLQTKLVIDKDFEDHEFIFVDDGSKDNTLEELKKLSASDTKVKVIGFSRNFGHEIATACGIDYATGDYNVIMDADLQDPPIVIKDMVNKCVSENYDVVYAVRRTREGETIFKRLSSYLFYLIHSKLSDIPIPRNTGDFRVFSARVREDIKKVKEKNRYMRGIISWVGYRQTGILFDRQKREKGKTNYNFFKLLNLALLGISSFTTKPLRIASYLGIGSILLSFFVACYAIYSKVAGKAISGWTSLTLIMLFYNSIMFILLGILGEYISHIFYEVKERPLYLIKEEINVENRREKYV